MSEAIYDIDFDQQAPELLPPDKRDDNTITLVQSLLKAVQWCRDLLFTSYKEGATADAYAAGTYNKYEQVIFEKAVYYSLIDNNTDDPTNSTWLKIQDNFLGVSKRVQFNGQVVVLEYALNLRFNGTFRPPGSTSLSDIYLTNIAATLSGFFVGETEEFSSAIGQTDSEDKIGLPFSYSQAYNFQINIPSALYDATNEQAIRDFVNLYIPVSLNYSIVEY